MCLSMLTSVGCLAGFLLLEFSKLKETKKIDDGSNLNTDLCIFGHDV